MTVAVIKPGSANIIRPGENTADARRQAVLAATSATTAQAARDAALAVANFIAGGQAAAEAATSDGDLFSYLDGSDQLVLARRTSGSSVALDTYFGAEHVGTTADGSVQDAIDARPSATEVADIRAMAGGDGDITATVRAVAAAGHTLAKLRTGAYTMDPGVELGHLHIEGDGESTVLTANYPGPGGGQTIYRLSYDAETAAFTAGETLTGGTSVATATIWQVFDNGTTGFLLIYDITGTFADNEALSDTGGGAATANGTTGTEAVYRLAYDAQTAAFTLDAVLTGGTSGATATIWRIVDDGATGFVLLYGVLGTFQDDEALTDSAGGAATANGTARVPYLFEATGSSTQIADLASDVSAGATSLPFASSIAATLAADDLIQIYNPTDHSYSSHRPEYRAGEYCVLKSVSGSTAKPIHKLFAGYAAAAVDVYKITAAQGGLSKMRIEGPGGVRVFRAKYGRNNRVRFLVSKNAAVHSVVFDRCYNFHAYGNDLFNVGEGSSDYAIFSGNCQLGVAKRSTLYARRHPVAIGGTDVAGESGFVPNRLISVVECKLANDIDSTADCADFHGNSEFCSYIDCDISGGGTIAGVNNGYTDCRIDNALSGVCLYGGEIRGGDYWARRCRFVTYTNPATGSRGVIDLSDACLNDNTTSTVNLFVENSRVKSSALSSSSSIVRLDCENTTGTLTVNVIIEGLKLDVNALGFILYTDKTGAGSVSSSRIVVDRVTGAPSGTYLHLPNGNYFRDFPHRLQMQGGKVDDSTPAVAARSYVSAAQVYPLKYPREPNGSVTLAPQGTGTISGVLGGAAGTVTGPLFNQKKFDQCILTMAANNNWGTSQAFRLNWAVWMNEAA